MDKLNSLFPEVLHTNFQLWEKSENVKDAKIYYNTNLYGCKIHEGGLMNIRNIFCPKCGSIMHINNQFHRLMCPICMEVGDKTIPMIQPDLPDLRNDSQRRKFIESYTSWPLWIAIKETGERYYRYDLTDTITIVVKASKQHIPGRLAEDAVGYGYGSEQYYLLGVKIYYDDKDNLLFEEDTKKTFYESRSSKAILNEYLKKFQQKNIGEAENVSNVTCTTKEWPLARFTQKK